jgi:[CysO sulfur-carrier protein]-S-L-cysteine hydrolase
VSPPATLLLAADVAEALFDHARAELPNEACGLLSGPAGRATNFHPARNALGSPRRYDLHPEDLVRLMFEIESAGDELVAIFHSHTRAPAVPSPTDVRSAEYRVPYLIASLEEAGPGPMLRAWWIQSGEVAEIPLRLA